MNSLLERLVNFLQRRLVPCAASVQEPGCGRLLRSPLRRPGAGADEASSRSPNSRRWRAHRKDSAAKASALPNREPRADGLSVQLEYDSWPARLRTQGEEEQHGRRLRDGADARRAVSAFPEAVGD
ncbi:hypothetical protein MRX96_051177 [Rhipicephalus microplus]